MKSTKLINKKSFAFTLAEVVVVMAILGVMMAAFAPVVTKRSLSTHENSRLWQRTDDFKGIYFGTAHDTKKVLIGETTIPDSGKYFHPKLTITSTLIDPENDTKRVTPQIAFRIKDHNNSGPRNAGYLFMTASKIQVWHILWLCRVCTWLYWFYFSTSSFKS